MVYGEMVVLWLCVMVHDVRRFEEQYLNFIIDNHDEVLKDIET